MRILLLAFIGIAQGSIMPGAGRYRSEIVDHTLLLAETSMARNMNECLLRSYCIIGAANEVPQGSIGEGIRETFKIISSVVKTHSSEERKMPNLERLVSSYELGGKMGDPICDSVFRCDISRDDLTLVPEVRGRLGNVKCSNVGAVCPGASVGCSICGLVTGGICTAPCTLAGTFCSGSGYLCSLQNF